MIQKIKQKLADDILKKNVEGEKDVGNDDFAIKRDDDININEDECE